MADAAGLIGREGCVSAGGGGTWILVKGYVMSLTRAVRAMMDHPYEYGTCTAPSPPWTTRSSGQQ